MDETNESPRGRFLRTWGLALVIVVLVILWMASGGDSPSAENGPPDAASADESDVFTVLARQSVADEVARTVEYSGDTEPDKVINLAAQVAGEITAIGAPRGKRLAKGDLIARVDERDLQAQLSTAKAALHQRELEYQASIPLRKDGVITEADLASAQANLEAARAQLASIRLQLKHVTIASPVAGILEARQVESGDYVKVGAPVATVIVNNPLIVSGGVSENEVEQIEVGQSVTATLSDGHVLTGRVRFVSARADAQTRTFTIEAEVENRGMKIPAGLSADIAIPVGKVMAHRMDSSLLALDDDGVLGVKAVAPNSEVVFHKATIERADGNAIWVSGLPENVRLITRGQGFVQPGERVAVDLDDAE